MVERDSSFAKVTPSSLPLGTDVSVMGIQNNKLRRIPLAQILATAAGQGGSGGEGFTFASLSDFISDQSTQAHASIIDRTSQPTIRNGDDIVGQIEFAAPSPDPSTPDIVVMTTRLAIGSSLKLKLYNNQNLAILGSANYPTFIGQQSAKILTSLSVTNSVLTGMINTTPTGLYTGWIVVTRTATALVITINDGNVFETIPLAKSSFWLSAACAQYTGGFTGDNGNGSLDYDLTDTHATNTRVIDLTEVVDNVIYQADEDIDVLDKRIAKNDYVQFHGNKTAVINFPQLSRLYDFDVGAVENNPTTPVDLINYNPIYQVIPGQTARQGTVRFPDRHVDFGVLSDISQATLDTFNQVDAGGNQHHLVQKQGLDPQGQIREIIAEFSVPKTGYLFPNNGSVGGNASESHIYIYAGTDRTKNYLLLTITAFPTQSFTWSKVDAQGVTTTYPTKPKADTMVKADGGLWLSQKALTTVVGLDSIIDQVASDYVKVLDYTDTNPNVAIKVSMSVSQAALDANFTTLPIQNAFVICGVWSIPLNLRPIKLDFASGELALVYPKHQDIVQRFVPSEDPAVFIKMFDLGAFPKFIRLSVTYNANTDSYDYAIGQDQINRGGSITVQNDADVQVIIRKGNGVIQILIDGNLLFTAPDNSPGTPLMWADMVLCFRGNASQTDVTYDMTNANGLTYLDTSTIRNRDRLRVIGGDLSILGQTVKEGSIVEFFDNDEEILVTPPPADPLLTKPTRLIVKDLSENLLPVDQIEAWYDPIRKRITLGGSFNCVNVDNGYACLVCLPDALANLGYTWSEDNFFPFSCFVNGSNSQGTLRAHQTDPVQFFIVFNDMQDIPGVPTTILIPESVIAINTTPGV